LQEFSRVNGTGFVAGLKEPDIVAPNTLKLTLEMSHASSQRQSASTQQHLPIFPI
jgi:hypothetical protein